jgi:hypothetical protein
VIINPPDSSTILADIFIPGLRKIPEAGAVASAERGNPAFTACFLKIRLEISEPRPQGTVHYGPDVALYKVSDLPFTENEKIAWVTVSIMFDDQVAAAFLVVAA